MGGATVWGGGVCAFLCTIGWHKGRMHIMRLVLWDEGRGLKRLWPSASADTGAQRPVKIPLKIRAHCETLAK